MPFLPRTPLILQRHTPGPSSLGCLQGLAAIPMCSPRQGDPLTASTCIYSLKPPEKYTVARIRIVKKQADRALTERHFPPTTERIDIRPRSKLLGLAFPVSLHVKQSRLYKDDRWSLSAYRLGSFPLASESSPCVTQRIPQRVSKRELWSK